MGRRFSNVMLAPVLQTQFTRYMDWLNDTPAARQTAFQAVRNPAGRARNPQEIAYIRPFNNSRPNLFFETKALDRTPGTVAGPRATDAMTLLIALTTGTPDLTEYNTPDPATNTVLPMPKYKFARVIASDRTSATPEQGTSRMTGKVYSRHRSFSASQPFGQGTSAVNTYDLAVTTMKQNPAYASWFNDFGNRVSFIPERGTVL